MIGELAALGAAIVWAVSSLLLKPLSGKFNALALSGFRSLTAAILFGLILLFSGKASFLPQASLWMVTGLIMGTFIGIGLGESYFVKALRHIDVSQAYPISICGYPVVTVLLATLFLRELLTWAALLGTLLVITGVYLIAFPKGGIGLKLVFSSASQRTGLWLVFLTVITWAVATIIIKQSLGHGDLVVANFIRLSGNAFLIFLLTRPYWQSFHPRHQGWLRVSSAGLTGILSFGIGGILFLVGLQYAGAAKTSVLASTSPLFLVPMAVFFLKERVTAKLISGVILSIIGITMVVT